MKNSEILSVDLLRSLLKYDSETGVVTWAVDFHGRAKAGREFGELRKSKRTSYRFGKIYGRRYHSHHVAWAIHYGSWPDGVIDHINHDGLDNRIKNLRVVSVHENNRNVRLRKTNTSGHVGVSWYPSRSKWRAQISISGRSTTIGYFLNLYDAVSARKAASALHGYHQNHGQDS